MTAQRLTHGCDARRLRVPSRVDDPNAKAAPALSLDVWRMSVRTGTDANAQMTGGSDFRGPPSGDRNSDRAGLHEVYFCNRDHTATPPSNKCDFMKRTLKMQSSEVYNNAWIAAQLYRTHVLGMGRSCAAHTSYQRRTLSDA